MVFQHPCPDLLIMHMSCSSQSRFPNRFPTPPQPAGPGHRFLELKSYVLKRRDELVPRDERELSAEELMSGKSKAKGFAA